MPVTAMNHFTILTSDVPRTVTFYRELLGLPMARVRRSNSRARGSMRAVRRFCTS